jgi:spore coat protein A
VLTVITRFEGYTGRYVFHCHMLEHEDNDMMRPYEVVADEEKSQKA